MVRHRTIYTVTTTVEGGEVMTSSPTGRTTTALSRFDSTTMRATLRDATTTDDDVHRYRYVHGCIRDDDDDDDDDARGEDDARERGGDDDGDDVIHDDDDDDDDARVR